ncbi:MAG TPA: hypothetical protein VGH86_04475 [Phenylobacterium sp.]|jgi:hypothetical protein
MTQARAAFQSQLRQAVRDAHAPRPTPATWQGGAPGRPRRVAIRLWLPLTPLWLILAPFALLAAPLLLAAPQMRGVRPVRAALAVGAALIALSGTVVDVDTPDALVSLRIL